MSHVELELLAYLDGELSPAEAQTIEAHLVSCPSCKVTLDELRVLAAGMQTTLPVVYESVHLPADAEARIRSTLAAERARQSRAGSPRRGDAGFLAALQNVLRPLGKAAIPLMAVFFVALTLNVTRLPAQSGVQQTVVLGQDTLSPGSQAAVRVVVRNRDDGQPIANANVAVQLRQAGLAKAVYAGTTDATGSAPVQFAVPSDWQGSAEIVVDTDSQLGDDQLVAPIVLQRSYRVLLGSDKPVYQPGETLHLRTLALGTVDGNPADGATVRFEVIDPDGQLILAEEKPSSEFGIASIDLPLASDAAFGQYQVKTTLGDTVSELTITLGQAPLPKFRVDVLPDAPYYLTGERLTGAVNASYFYGKPLAGAPVTIRLVGTKPTTDTVAGEQQIFVDELTGATSDAGSFAFGFDLPNLPPDAFAEDDTILVAIEASVVDAAGDDEFGWQKVTMASQPILIDVVPEDGILHTGVENILYVLTSYPDGQPAPTSLQMRIGSAATIDQATNEYGLAEVRFTPRSGADGERQVDVTATDAAGDVGRAIVVLPLDEAKETLLLRTERALLQVGDTLAAEAIATGADEAVYLDVIKGGQTLLTQSSLVADGKATFAIDLTPEFAGTLELNAYQVTGDDAILRDSRAAVVESPENVQVAVTTDKPEYRPGEEAQITVRTSRADQGVETAVGLAVVNEAVYAQREYQPGFARSYFILDKALHTASLGPAEAALAATSTGADVTTHEAQQLAAKASWAAYSGRDYSLAARSVDEESRNQINQKRQQAFGRLSVWLGLALILASLGVVTTVVVGLRRTGVLGHAASRLLLTVVVFAVAGAGLLFVTQKVMDMAPAEFTSVAVAVMGITWLVLLAALLVLGVRTRDHRIQYVALWLFVYAVLLVLLAFAAGQGAMVAPPWLMILAVSFGVLLATLVLFGWGLRAEGAKAAGLVALLLAVLVLPLIVALTAADLKDTDVVETIAAPSIYGLSGGLLIGCAAPSTAPQPVLQSAGQAPVVQEAPAAAPENNAAPEMADATEAGATEPASTVVQAPQAAEQLAVEEPTAVELAEASPTATEIPASEPDLALQVEATPELPALAESAVVTVETALRVEETTGVVTLTVVPISAQVMTESVTLTAAAVVSETIVPSAMAASPLSTTTELVSGGAFENQVLTTGVPTATITTALTSTLLIEPQTRRALSETATATPVPVNDATPAAAIAAGSAPVAESPTAAPTPEPVAPSPTSTPEPTSVPTPEPTPTVLLDSPPALEAQLIAPAVTTPGPAPAPAVAVATSTPAPEVRIRQQPRPAPVPLEALPIIRERFPQTLYWNPEAVTDTSGRVQVTIPTGDSITSWRITAQAVDRNGGLGSTTAPLVVFQPLFLVVDVPAELVVGQQVTGQVQIFNYGATPQTMLLISQSTAGLQLDQAEQTVIVQANDVVTVPVVVRAVQSGSQTATWIAMSDETQDAQQVTIMVR